jgi:hypothetical protein
MQKTPWPSLFLKKRDLKMLPGLVNLTPFQPEIDPEKKVAKNEI